MKRGMCFVTLAIVIIVIPFCALGNETSLYVNGKSVNLNLPLEEIDDQTFVPLDELGLHLGTESTLVEEENSLAIRTTSGELLFPVDCFPILHGAYYAPLEQLVSISSARIHNIGSEIYIESEASRLTGINIQAEDVGVRFDAFAPYQELPTKPNILHLRFYHCVLDATPQQIIPKSDIIKSVALSVSSDYTADLIIILSHESAVGIKRFIAEGVYSISFSFNQTAFAETEERISPYITYHALSMDIQDKPVILKYLYIDEWRDHFKLLPAVCLDGVGPLCSLEKMARFHRAQAAINANSYDAETDIPAGLVIIDGQALRLDYEDRAALGIDILGRLNFFNPEVSLYLCTEDTKVLIDDLNRPIEPREVIMYTAGYSGPVSRGFGEYFLSLKIKSDRVASLQQGPYVVTDPQAELVVACGSASDRLASLVVGDTVSLELRVDGAQHFITNAVGDGTLLYLNGNKLLTPTEEGADADLYMVDRLTACTVLATDWYGGLILMAVVKNATSAGTDLAGLHDVLDMVPVKLKNAIAFNGEDSGSLVFTYQSTYREISSGGKVAVGLLLVPIDQ
jgi:hypothetical protein